MLHSPPQSLLEIFVEMEKRTMLAENNLETLKSICDQVNKSLLGKIEDYERSSTGSQLVNSCELGKPSEKQLFLIKFFFFNSERRMSLEGREELPPSVLDGNSHRYIP